MIYHSTSPWLGTTSGPNALTLYTSGDVGDGKEIRFPQEGYNENFARLNWGIQKCGIYITGSMTLEPDASADMRNIVAVDFTIAPSVSPTYPPDPENPASEFTGSGWVDVVQPWTVTQSVIIGGEIFDFLTAAYVPVYVSIDIFQLNFQPWTNMVITDGVPTFYGSFRLQLVASWEHDAITGSSGNPLPFQTYDTVGSIFGPSFNIDMPADFNEAVVKCYASSGVNVSLVTVTDASFEIGQWRGNVRTL